MNHNDEDFLKKSAEAKARVPQVDPNDVDKALAEKTVVIDVRESEEHAKGSVPGAVNVSIETLAEQVVSLVTDKTAPVICFCNGGNRGSLAAAKLQDLGYTNVSSIAGGLKAYLASKEK